MAMRAFWEDCVCGYCTKVRYTRERQGSVIIDMSNMHERALAPTPPASPSIVDEVVDMDPVELERINEIVVSARISPPMHPHAWARYHAEPELTDESRAAYMRSFARNPRNQE